jgi:hypothetical protein
MSNSRAHRNALLPTALALGLLCAGWASQSQARTVHAVVRVEPQVRADIVARRLLQLQRDGEISSLVWIAGDNSQGISPTAILDFSSESRYARWMAREIPRFRGAVDVVKADRIARGGESSHDNVLQVKVYQPNVGPGTYREYAAAYVVPLMERQRESGSLNDFAIYLEHDAEAGKGRAITVTGYSDVRALGDARRVKERARSEMSERDSAYREWNVTQAGIRTPIARSFAAFACFESAN